VEIVGEKVGIFGKLSHEDAQEIAERAIERYTKGEIDAVYVAFNEFKSVIAQRLVVEQILPIKEIGREEILQAQVMTEEERKRAGEAARTAGVSTANSLSRSSAPFNSRSWSKASSGTFRAGNQRTSSASSPAIGLIFSLRTSAR
jgi:hypothetical protein